MSGDNSSLSLRYGFIPTPNQILASPSGGIPYYINLEVIVSVPGINPVTITHLEIDIGVGQEISADLSMADLPAPVYDPSIPWRFNAAGSTLTMTPATGTVGTVTSPIVFTLPNIKVNEVPGTVPITITEYYPPPNGNASDNTTYSLLKQPSDFPITSFTVAPAILYDFDQTVTLSWTCSTQGQTDGYGLRIASVGKDPARGANQSHQTMGTTQLNNCFSDGKCYSCAQGQAGVLYGPVQDDMTFALDAVQTTSTGGHIVVATVEASVQIVTPKFADNATVTYGTGQMVWLHWLAQNASYCTVQLDADATPIDANAPTDTWLGGYLVWLAGQPGTHTLTVTAYAATGDSQDHFTSQPFATAATRTLPVGASPGVVTIAPDNSVAVVGGGYYAGLNLIDLTTWKVTTIPLSPPGDVFAIAITPDSKLALIARVQAKQVAVLDLTTRQIRPNPIDVPSAQSIAISPDGSLALIGDGDTNQIYVVDLATMKIEPATIPITGSPDDIAITPDGTLALVVSDDLGALTVIDMASRQAESKLIPVGSVPTRVAITPDSGLAVVANTGDDTISLVNIAARPPYSPTVPTGSGPQGIAMVPGGRYAIVANLDSQNLTVVDLMARTTRTIPAGNRPSAVAISPKGSGILVTNMHDGTVSVF